MLSIAVEYKLETIYNCSQLFKIVVTRIGLSLLNFGIFCASVREFIGQLKFVNTTYKIKIYFKISKVLEINILEFLDKDIISKTVVSPSNFTTMGGVKVIFPILFIWFWILSIHDP